MREPCFQIVLSVLVLLVAPGVCAPVSGQVIYVDAGAAGANDGSSWADAYDHLQDALVDANSADKPVEIRVAQGVYRPDQGAGVIAGDREAAFHLINGVTIKGGYAGLSGIDPDVRQVEAYQTILSGDLAQNDTDLNDVDNSFDDRTRHDNSQQVVVGSHTDRTAVIDGFNITAGHSVMGFPYDAGGAGMLIESGSPTIVNCLFTGNTSIVISYLGGGSLLSYNGSSPRLVDCTFRNNDTGLATMNNVDSSPVLVNCIFEHNESGGLQHSGDGVAVLTGCTFSENSRAAVDSTGKVELTSCTFSGNLEGAVHQHGLGSMTLTGCLFSRNCSLLTGAVKLRSGGMTLRGCKFVGNVAERGDGAGIMCLSGKLSVINCEFRANVGEYGGALSEHVTSHLVVENCVFVGNLAKEKGGAIYTCGDHGTVRNCTFSGNWADGGGASLFVSRFAWPAPSVTNCIFWGDGMPAIEAEKKVPLVSYCDIEGGWPGEGNMDIDPCFAEPGHWDVNGTPEDFDDDFWVDGDYHLLSQAGRWDQNSGAWVQDSITSPCIDAGDPASPIGLEPFPNGGRVNMGAYGACDQASKSYFGEPVCDTVIAGDINGDCRVDYLDLAIVCSHWLTEGEDFVNKPPTVRVIEPQDGDRIKWPGPTIFRAEAGEQLLCLLHAAPAQLIEHLARDAQK